MLIHILNARAGSDGFEGGLGKRETTDYNRFNLFSSEIQYKLHAKPFRRNVSILIKYLKTIKCRSAARVTHTNVQFLLLPKHESLFEND